MAVAKFGVRVVTGPEVGDEFTACGGTFEGIGVGLSAGARSDGTDVATGRGIGVGCAVLARDGVVKKALSENIPHVFVPYANQMYPPCPQFAPH